MVVLLDQTRNRPNFLGSQRLSELCHHLCFSSLVRFLGSERGEEVRQQPYFYFTHPCKSVFSIQKAITLRISTFEQISQFLTKPNTTTYPFQFKRKYLISINEASIPLTFKLIKLFPTRFQNISKWPPWFFTFYSCLTSHTKSILSLQRNVKVG